MGNYLQAIWRCRYFWLSLVKMDLRTRYRRSVLGLGWSLLHPISMTIILCTVFSKLFGIEIKSFGLSLLAGLACWNYFMGCALSGCQCFFQGESYIRQYPAPLAIYPLRTALGGAVHFSLALIVVIGVSWLFNGFDNVPALISLVPSCALLLIMGWSMAVLAAFGNVYFQDTQHLTEVGFQLLFYATPIVYPVEILQKNNLGWLLEWNPLVPVLALIREPILKGHLPSTATFTTAATVVFVLAASATVTLARLQRRLVFHL